MNNIYDTTNEKSRATFPGYDQYVAKQQEQKQERAERAAARDALRTERRKNSLPPFLMVRAGVYNTWLIPLLGLATMVATYESEQNLSQSMQILAGIFGAVLFVPGSIIAMSTMLQAEISATTYANNVRRALNDYAKSAQLSSNTLVGDNSFPRISARLLKLITRRKAKNDARLFNNMLKNPESIKDATIATNIVAGHLKSHPEDATQVESVFDINTMPKQLQKRVMRILIARSK